MQLGKSCVPSPQLSSLSSAVLPLLSCPLRDIQEKRKEGSMWKQGRRGQTSSTTNIQMLSKATGYTCNVGAAADTSFTMNKRMGTLHRD